MNELGLFEVLDEEKKKSYAERVYQVLVLLVCLFVLSFRNGEKQPPLCLTRSDFLLGS